MADRFSDSLHRNSKRIFSVASFAGVTNPFSDERRRYLLVDVKSSDAALKCGITNTYRMMTSYIKGTARVVNPVPTLPLGQER